MHGGREAAGRSDLEVRDARGELVNMVGGHLKGLVPPVCRLALRTVVDGGPGQLREAGGKVLGEVTFACLGSRLRVTVLKRG